MEQAKSSHENIKVNHDSRPVLPYDLIRIPVKHLADIWPYTLPLVERGLTANPNMTIDDLLEGLSDESIQLWIVLSKAEFAKARRQLRAVFFTSIERDRTEWVLSLYGLGGERPREWVMACHEEMHKFAKAEDCKRVRMCGRPAWQRILPGYQVTGKRQGHLVYERAVE